MSQTYAAVDDSGDPTGAADWQELMARWPAVRAYKDYTYRLIGELAPVLDVGCGPGLDLVAVGTSHAVGVDLSAVMCGRAREPGVRVCQGSADVLPFADQSFGASRTDRVLQHVPDPTRALEEMVRVTRPGGLVVAEPDQESLVIAAPSVSNELCDRVKAARRDVGYRNGRLASRLPALFHDLGLTDITVTGFPLVLTDPADAFGLPNWPAQWRDAGVGQWSDADLAEWDRGMQAAQSWGFVYALTFLVVAGRRA